MQQSEHHESSTSAFGPFLRLQWYYFGNISLKNDENTVNTAQINLKLVPLDSS